MNISFIISTVFDIKYVFSLFKDKVHVRLVGVKVHPPLILEVQGSNLALSKIPLIYREALEAL